MSADFVFSIANTAALLSWVALGLAVWRRWDGFRDHVLGYFVPLALSGLYAALIILFFFQSDGGFGSLSDVKMLFTSDWVALAGWVHYLAFDLFVGCWIARQVMDGGNSRWWLVGLLPLTFLFGPVGFLAFEAMKLMSRPTQQVTT